VGTYRVFRRLLITFMATASLAAIPLAAAPQAASAGSRAPRLAAYLWAYHHTAGHAYCWAGAGPSCYDCSGVVMAAYAREGIRFGRSTTAMLGSGRLVRETERQARRGDGRPVLAHQSRPSVPAKPGKPPPSFLKRSVVAVSAPWPGNAAAVGTTRGAREAWR